MDTISFNKLQKEKKVELIDESSEGRKKEEVLKEEEKELGEFDFTSLVEELKTVHRPVDAVPSYIPKSFLQQFVLYENGVTRRLYVFMNGGWYYATLT